MSTNARQGWNAAKRASERPLHKRVEHKPVGVRPSALELYRHGVMFEGYPESTEQVCSTCGHHLCSCPKAPPIGLHHAVSPFLPPLLINLAVIGQYNPESLRGTSREPKTAWGKAMREGIEQLAANAPSAQRRAAAGDWGEREWRDNFQDVMLRNRAVLELQEASRAAVELDAITRELNRQVSFIAHTCPAHVERRIREGNMPVVVNPALEENICFVNDEAIYVSPMVYAKVKAEFAAKPESAREAADRMYRERGPNVRASEYMGRWNDRPPPETPEQRAAFKAALADF